MILGKPLRLIINKSFLGKLNCISALKILSGGIESKADPEIVSLMSAGAAEIVFGAPSVPEETGVTVVVT